MESLQKIKKDVIKHKGIVGDRSAICPPSCGQGDMDLDWSS
ncbi:MAG TPA: hypothetical protein PLY81_00620 [Chitinophagaceae bacterium]|nr:hypothetical protein [Chitinophagaceae bacterium]